MARTALGINLDLYDSGVTVVRDGGIVFAANEERYTRRKNQGGLPRLALQSALDQTGIAPRDIECIVAAGTTTPPLPMRLFPALHARLADDSQSREPGALRRVADAAIFHTPLSSATANSRWGLATRPLLRPLLRRQLPSSLRQIPIQVVEHHRAHAAGAFGCSGFEEALVLTGDGMGDGLSFTVSRWKEGRGQRLWTARAHDSFGLFFEFLTEAFGFTPCRDEGKITGLAAQGNADAVKIAAPFAWRDERLVYTGRYGAAAVKWLRREVLDRYAREDVAAWAQQLLEEQVTAIARRWLDRTRLSKLAVAGGIFANVKLNQRLHALEGVESLFVYPNMGDGGLSLGGLLAEGWVDRSRLAHVYLGDYAYFEDADLDLSEQGSALATPDAVAALLAEGAVLARCSGRMEWGPRALGNRSILADARRVDIVKRLNTQLRRNDFMPFAPAMLAEDAPRYLRDWERATHAAEFMTVCFEVTELMQRETPAVVHVDGTVRAQLVRAETQPEFHAILSAFKRVSGCGVLLNTSFNLHEEPIVRTASEAWSAFERAQLDALVLEDRLITRAGVAGASGVGAGSGS